MKKRNMVATASLVGLISASTFALAESNSVFRYPVYGAKASSNIDVETGGEETPSSNITSPINIVFTEIGDQLSANVGDSATITIRNNVGSQLGQTSSNSEGDFTSPLNPSVLSSDVIELTITNGEDTIVANITVPEGIGNTLDPEMVAMCANENYYVEQEEVVFPAYTFIPYKGVLVSPFMPYPEEPVWVSDEINNNDNVSYIGYLDFTYIQMSWESDTIEEIYYLGEYIDPSELIYGTYGYKLPNGVTFKVEQNGYNNHYPFAFNSEVRTGHYIPIEYKTDNLDWCVDNGYEIDTN